MADVDLSVRVARVEANYESLTLKVEDISAKVDQGIALIQAQLRDADLRRAQENKPQWNILISAVSVLVVIGSLSLAPLYSNFSDLKQIVLQQENVFERKLEVMQHDYVSHISDGHPEIQSEKIKQLRLGIDRISDRVNLLTIEIKDLTAEVTSKISALEEKNRKD